MLNHILVNVTDLVQQGRLALLNNETHVSPMRLKYGSLSCIFHCLDSHMAHCLSCMSHLLDLHTT